MTNQELIDGVKAMRGLLKMIVVMSALLDAHGEPPPQGEMETEFQSYFNLAGKFLELAEAETHGA